MRCTARSKAEPPSAQRGGAAHHTFFSAVKTSSRSGTSATALQGSGIPLWWRAAAPPQENARSYACTLDLAGTPSSRSSSGSASPARLQSHALMRWCQPLRAVARQHGSGHASETVRPRGCQRPCFHRLGWNRLGYGEMTEELRVPCDHLEKLHLLRPSVLKLALF